MSMVLALCLTTASSCATVHVDDRLSSLEAEEQRRQARLDDLELQISSAEQRVMQAKADAQYQECRANRTKLEADVAVASANCTQVVAQRGACIAKGESRTTKGTGLGCAAGWAAAFFTGGAAAPAIAIGCASGAALSHATRSECGEVPSCAVRGDHTGDVLREHGLAAMPVCSLETFEAKPAEPVPVHPLFAGPKPPPKPPGECETWRIEWIDFNAPQKKRNGDAWDNDGSDPDLVYMIYVGGQRLYRSPKYEAAQWKHAPQAVVVVSSGQDLSLELADRDIGGNERIGSFQGVIPQELASGEFTLTSGRATARIRLACSGD